MEDEVFFPILIIALLASFIVLKIMEQIKKDDRRHLPPGPRGLPIIGNLHQLNHNKLHHSLLRLSNKYGPLILLQLGSIPTLVVSSHHVAEEIFTKHDIAISGRPPLTAFKKIFYNLSGIAVAPYGDNWRQARKIAMQELLNSRRVRSFQAVREEEVGKLVTAIKRDDVANLSEMTLSLANNVICRVALGDKFGDGGYGGKGGARVRELFSETQRLLAGFCVADFFPGMEWIDRLTGMHGRMEKNLEEINDFFDRVISENLSSYNGGEEDNGDENLMQALLRLHKAAVHRGSFLSNMEHVKAIISEMFVAGTDTSSATITWTMTELMRNPRVMNKLQQELKQVINDSRLIQESDLDKLNYLNRVVKESMRLRNPVPLSVPRQTIEPCEIQGYSIPVNMRVMFNNAAISIDPSAWEKPLEFWPERFEGSGVDFKGQDFKLLPFGSGRRRCPGIGFSTVLIELTLANLIHCFNWSLPNGMKAEDISIEEAPGITTHKKLPLCLVAISKW